MSFFERAISILIVVNFLVVIAYLWSVARFYRYLKREHPTAWQNLGSPSLILNNSIKNNWLVMVYLIRQKYRQLDDRFLYALAMRVIALWSVFLFFFVLMIVCIHIVRSDLGVG